MTLQQCRYLIEIAKYESLTKAAQALFVTQPSISRAVRELERELDIQILARASRGVHLTASGQELLGYAKMLVAQEENLRAHFEKNNRAATHFAVSSQHFSFAAEAVARLMQRLAETRYEITFLEGKLESVIADVAHRRACLGIVCVSALNREALERSFLRERLVFQAFAALPVSVFLGRHHPLAGEAQLELWQLAPYPCLTYRRDDMPLNLAEGPIGEAERIVYVEDRGTMDGLLLHSNGYNLGTGCMSPDFMEPQIVAVPLKAPWYVHVGYLRRSDEALSSPALQFLDDLREALQRALPKTRQ